MALFKKLAVITLTGALGLFLFVFFTPAVAGHQLVPSTTIKSQGVDDAGVGGSGQSSRIRNEGKHNPKERVATGRPTKLSLNAGSNGSPLSTVSASSFQFTPSPLALGGTSNTWTVPAGPTRVYVKVEFSSFQQFKPTSSGPITVFWYPTASSTTKQKYEIRQRDDSSVLFGDSAANHAKAGSRVWIEVANDAFAAESPLVTLTFHSGTNHNGTEIAGATVQKQARPFTPVSGSANADATADTVTLTWSVGGGQGTPTPDHYEVVVPGSVANAAPLFSNTNVDDSSFQPSVVINNSRTALGTGSHTAEVRHCNAVGGCSDPLSINFTVPPAPTPAFQFTPSPIALGGTSNTWTVPAGPTRVYVKVEFSSFQQFKPTTSGPITVFWYPTASSTTKQKYEIRQRDDSAVLFGDTSTNHAKAGSRVWIEVADDAFAAESPLVTLTFHSGTDHTGTEIAGATVQKQARPFTPVSGSASADATADTVTLTWSVGGGQGTPTPDHYEVVVPGSADNTFPGFSNTNVDDSSSSTSLVINNSRTVLGTGVSHRRSAPLQRRGRMLRAPVHQLHRASGADAGFPVHAEPYSTGRHQQHLDRSHGSHQGLREGGVLRSFPAKRHWLRPHQHILVCRQFTECPTTTV